MKLREFRLLTDENVDPKVVAWLRGPGFDVFDISENSLQGSLDIDLLRRAVAENRAGVTHDADFGTLAVHQGEPIVGLVYLRPGHIDAQFTIGTIEALLTADPDVTPPFLLIAKRSDRGVTIRVRHLTP